jgi:hypothetical protein
VGEMSGGDFLAGGGFFRLTLKCMKGCPKSFRERWRALGVAALLASTVSVGLCDFERPFPGAKQIGLSCAFYANVPALTKASGICIVDDTEGSRSFVSAIYGLRRGDFEFRSAFDKEVFFELFGMPSTGARLDYGDGVRRDLTKQAERLITEVFEPALDRGNFISLRARGPFGGPHNVLLVAHANGKYRVHDPTTGKIRVTGRPGLAADILSESKAKSTALKKRYFTGYRVVHVGRRGFSGNPLRLGQLPEAVRLRLTDRQRGMLAETLTVAAAFDPARVEQVVEAFPQVDFAVVSRKAKGTQVPVSAIDAGLKAKELRGLAHLAKLSINSYQTGQRELLPVWMIGGKPHVVTGYAAAAGGGKGTVVLDDGSVSAERPLGEVLDEIAKDGALIGHVACPRE